LTIYSLKGGIDSTNGVPLALALGSCRGGPPEGWTVVERELNGLPLGSELLEGELDGMPHSMYNRLLEEVKWSDDDERFVVLRKEAKGRGSTLKGLLEQQCMV
jgi:hypothetical protein